MAQRKSTVTKKEMKEFLNKKYPGYSTASLYSEQIINYVLRKFPSRVSEANLAAELNITTRWVQIHCKEVFNTRFTRICTLLRVYNAAILIINTNRSINSIAQQLEYSHTNNINNDFNKVLGIAPTKIKKDGLTIQQLFGKYK